MHFKKKHTEFLTVQHSKRKIYNLKAVKIRRMFEYKRIFLNNFHHKGQKKEDIQGSKQHHWLAVFIASTYFYYYFTTMFMSG